MCGDSGFDDNIDSILVMHPDRAARQHQATFHEGAIYLPSLNDVDLADSYVPFDSSAEAVDKKDDEKDERINSGLLALIVVGTIFGLISLMDYIAKGEAIPTTKPISYQVNR